MQKRRERINERLKILQNLIPNGTKASYWNSNHLTRGEKFITWKSRAISSKTDPSCWWMHWRRFSGRHQHDARRSSSIRQVLAAPDQGWSSKNPGPNSCCCALKLPYAKEYSKSSSLCAAVELGRYVDVRADRVQRGQRRPRSQDLAAATMIGSEDDGRPMSAGRAHWFFTVRFCFFLEFIWNIHRWRTGSCNERFFTV